MVQPFGNIPKLSDPGVAPAISGISSGIGNLLQLKQGRERNKQSTLNQLLQGGTRLQQQRISDEAALGRAKFNAPLQLLGAVDDLESAAIDAERNRNLTEAQRLRSLKNQIVGQIGNFGVSQQPGRVSTPTRGGATGLGFQQDPGLEGGGELVSEETGSFDVSDSTPPAGGEFGFRPGSQNVDIADQFSTPVQQETFKAQQDRTAAQVANIQGGTLENLQQAASAPEGTALAGLGGRKFIAKMNPRVRGFIEEAVVREANKPGVLDEVRKNVTDSIDFIEQTLEDAERIKQLGVIKRGILPGLQRTLATDPILGEFTPAPLKPRTFAAVQEKFMSPKEQEQFERALTLNNNIKSRVASFTKNLFSNTGALSEMEQETVARSLPSLNALSQGQFDTQLEEFARLVVPSMIKKAIQSGDVDSERRLQKIHKRVTGDFVTFSDEEDQQVQSDGTQPIDAAASGELTVSPAPAPDNIGVTAESGRIQQILQVLGPDRIRRLPDTTKVKLFEELQREKGGVQ